MRSAAPVPDVRLTYDDFLLFPDDGRRHELIDGVHYVTPAPRVRHQELVGRLHLALGNYLSEHPAAGRVLLAPVDVVLSNHDIVEPDLLVIAGDGHRHREERAGRAGAGHRGDVEKHAQA